jgi:EmrB/QacA subfamily drug resistance transporter
MTSTPPTDGPAAPASDKLDRGLMLIAACCILGAVMSILDVTVVNVALPALAADFDVSLTTVQWVATGYTLALATVIPLTGWGADRFGTKRLYVASIALFVAGSALAGLAWNAESLIFFRVLQGLGGGILAPASMTIMTRAAGPHRIGRVMSVIGIPMLLGPIFGPILGGWLVDDFSWRWIFLINLPIGIVALVMSQRILPKDVAQPGFRLDWLGLLLLSPGLAMLIYGFAESTGPDGFGATKVQVPAGVGVVLLVLFLLHARRHAQPLVDLTLFRNKVFSAAVGSLFLMIIAVFGGMLLMPLYLQNVRGESAFDTGLLLAPQGIGAMIGMPIAGRLTDRTGVGRIAPFGLTLIGISFVILTQLEADTSYWIFGASMLVMGLGMGFTMMPMFSGAMQTLRSAAVARASTALNISQQVGASIGTAVLTVVLTRITLDKVTALDLGGGGSTDGPLTYATLQQLPASVRDPILTALAHSYGDTFIWATALVVVALVVAAVLLPKHHVEPLGDEDDAAERAAAMLG